MEERNETVDALRALAALAVCFFHFTRFEHFQAVSTLGRAPSTSCTCPSADA